MKHMREVIAAIATVLFALRGGALSAQEDFYFLSPDAPKSLGAGFDPARPYKKLNPVTKGEGADRQNMQFIPGSHTGSVLNIFFCKSSSELATALNRSVQAEAYYGAVSGSGSFESDKFSSSASSSLSVVVVVDIDCGWYAEKNKSFSEDVSARCKEASKNQIEQEFGTHFVAEVNPHVTFGLVYSLAQSELVKRETASLGGRVEYSTPTAGAAVSATLQSYLSELSRLGEVKAQMYVAGIETAEIAELGKLATDAWNSEHVINSLEGMRQKVNGKTYDALSRHAQYMKARVLPIVSLPAWPGPSLSSPTDFLSPDIVRPVGDRLRYLGAMAALAREVQNSQWHPLRGLADYDAQAFGDSLARIEEQRAAIITICQSVHGNSPSDREDAEKRLLAICGQPAPILKGFTLPEPPQLDAVVTRSGSTAGQYDYSMVVQVKGCPIEKSKWIRARNLRGGVSIEYFPVDPIHLTGTRYEYHWSTGVYLSDDRVQEYLWLSDVFGREWSYPVVDVPGRCEDTDAVNKGLHSFRDSLLGR